jgi:hypothetical protein
MTVALHFLPIATRVPLKFGAETLTHVTGVALKTCKTQTGAILSLCWAKAHGMTLMVQNLTNAMQFYPEASAPEARVHPGLYARRGGWVDLSSLRGAGFGYRLDEIERPLPPPAFVAV